MKLSKVYEPAQYESDVYALWEKSDAFAPKGKGKPYSVVVPPPNANGNLHLGHALTLSVQDIAVRYHRMRGDNTLFLPGADHAGFETQVVYEKKLSGEGKSRFDYTREQLYEQIWDFVAQNRQNFESQFRRIGASVDWNHYTFTLDEKIVKRAYATFRKMWDEKLIYRGERLVNFCTFHGTAFADIEVEFKEVKGHLWYIRYPLTDGSGEILIATTRPETMLGDTAIAVHPDDTRYKALVGKTVKLPLTHREIPIIADSFVDVNFGTGAVKITPAHDPNDFEAGKRHDLPMISVVSHEGTITHDMPEQYRGLAVEDARQKVVHDLEKDGFITKTDEISHNVGHCYKCGTAIQPLLREQWFINMEPLAKAAIKSLENDEIIFHPATKKQQLITYLKNLKDWNISRQIAWGIPIPAFQNVDDPEDWIYNEQVDKEIISVDGKTYHRDPDVFDTWFSSGSWPFATLGYPNGDDFKKFYPLSLMETGFDILMPWVSRMIMLGLYITGESPFSVVYLHGLILDEHGQKMSKSKGNVVNPIEIADTYGSDALRMGIISGQSAGNNQPFGLPRIIGARNFANKLWNVARYVEGKLGDSFHYTNQPSPKTGADYWILEQIHEAITTTETHLDNYRFSEAYEAVYHLLWDDFADWYIEASKREINTSVLAYGLHTILKLVHPFAPFVTETIWQTLSWEKDSLLIGSAWPTYKKSTNKKATEFREIKEIVSEIRNLTNVLHLQRPHLYYSDAPFIKSQSALLEHLSNLEGVSEVRSGRGLQLTSTNYHCWLDVDLETTRDYLETLQNKMDTQRKKITQIKTRLANKEYLHKAPSHLIEQSKNQLENAEEVLTILQQEHDKFSDFATS